MGDEQQHTAMKKNEPMQIKSTKRKFKVPFARKNEEEEIRFKKESFSSTEMVNTTGQKNTTLGSHLVFRMKKSCALIILHPIILLKDLV